MPIEEKTNEYKTHKYSYNVYVDLNTQTKMGENLLQQYHDQTQKQCMDVGRIGYHDEYGRYIIDNYTQQELIVVPKLIIRVTEKAIDRAGKDVYQLRTYMSKFGQLNFVLTVDKDKAELFLVENIYVENINHKEDYETLLFRLSYYNQKPVPIKEIFYKFGIKANPDDYGKSWKEDEISINNIIVSKAKAEMTKALANKLASGINQKALVASLNYLNKEGEYGKKITSAYSQKVATQKEINKLATSPKLENTLNNVLLKTLEQQTTKKDLTDNTNFRVYKKVLDIQMSCPNQLAQEVNEANSKQNLKHFLLEVYQKQKGFSKSNEDEGILNANKQAEFESILDYKYDRRVLNENYLTAEEVFEPDSIRIKFEDKEYKDFEGKKVEVDLDPKRFENPENKIKKKQREKQEKLDKKKQKEDNKLKAKLKRKLKTLNAKCDIYAEFERSKTILGLEPKDRKKRKKLEAFFGEKQQNQKLTKEQKLQKAQEDNAKNEEIIKKLEKRVKIQSSRQEKIANKLKQKEQKLQVKQDKKAEKELLKKQKEEEKRKKLKMFFMEDQKQESVKKAKEEKGKAAEKVKDRPVIKQAPVVESVKKQEPKPEAKKEEKPATPKPEVKKEEKPKHSALTTLKQNAEKQEVKKEEKPQAELRAGFVYGPQKEEVKKPKEEESFVVKSDPNYRKEKIRAGIDMPDSNANYKKVKERVQDM